MHKQNLRASVERRLSVVKGEEKHIRHVLSTIDKKEKEPMKKQMSLALAIALMLLAGAAVAAGLTPTLNWIKSMYGSDVVSRIEQEAETMPIGQTTEMGDVVYEWVETMLASPAEALTPDDDENAAPEGAVAVSLHNTKALYGTVRITPKNGANVILIPEDVDVNTPMGFIPGRGGTPPDNAPTYAEKAAASGARILLAKAVPHGIETDGKLRDGYEIGYDYDAHPDGSLTYHYIIYGVPENLKAYTIRMRINNWEVTGDGRWLRGTGDGTAPEKDTWLKEDWTLTVAPDNRP